MKSKPSKAAIRSIKRKGLHKYPVGTMWFNAKSKKTWVRMWWGWDEKENEW